MPQPVEPIEISRPFTGSYSELADSVRAADRDTATISPGTKQTCIVISVSTDSETELQAYVHTLDLVSQQFRVRQASAIDEGYKRIVEAMVPPRPVTSTKLAQAQMHSRAKTAVLQSGDWITASEIADLAKLSSINKSSQPSKWKRDKRIFVIRHDGVDYFPLYGLDETSGYRPLADLKAVIAVLESRKDGWQMAYWFMSVNSWLDGQRPQDLLQSNPDKVLVAAREEVAEISHG